MMQNVSAAINTQINASRVKGVAPLAVFFDATSTTSTDTNKPFHELHFAWDFSDPTTSVWRYGNTNSRDKNKAYGPVAAHVFESPGTYIVNLATKGLNGDTSSRSVTITVQNPDTFFAGSNTVCFSTSGNYSGCPSGAQHIRTSSFQTVANHIGARKRLLLRKGETWSSSSRTNISTSGPGLITSFGSGSSRPVIRSTGSFSVFRVGYRVQNWRIVGLELIGAGGDDAILDIRGEAKDILFMGNKNIDGFGRAVIANNALFRLNNWDIPQRVFITENDLRLFSAHILFIAAGKLAIQGNYLDDTHTRGGEHVVRITHVEQAVITHNNIAHPQIGSKETLTIRNAQRELSCPYCGRDTRDIVLSDNDIFASGDKAVTLVQEQGHAYTAHASDAIIERNFFSQSADRPGRAQIALDVQNIDGVSIRHNIVYMKDWLTYRPLELTPGVTNVEVYNNSCYTPDNSSRRVRCVNNNGASNVRASNNLLYAPNHTGSKRVVDGSSSGGGNMIASANPFITKNINGPEDFILAAKSVAVDAGRRVPVYIDYARKLRSIHAKIDVGAYELGAEGAAMSMSAIQLLLIDN